jgi:hypothetical protein
LKGHDVEPGVQREEGVQGQDWSTGRIKVGEIRGLLNEGERN